MRETKAFTLAEVLITIGIIGVVASITIPTMLMRFQKTSYVSGIKKAYAQVGVIIKKLSAEYGCIGNFACTGFFDYGSGSQLEFGEQFAKYFKITKNCLTSTTEKCWPDSTLYYYEGSNTSSVNMNEEPGYKFISIDGMSFSLNNISVASSANSRCGHSEGSGEGNMKKVCAILTIDTNGFRGPNRFGRDTFQFWLTDGHGPVIYPVGGDEDSPIWSNSTNGCGIDASKYGLLCAGRVLEEGWAMNY